MSNGLDLSGHRFGYLEAKRPTGDRDSCGSVVWECLCDCGAVTYASSRRLRSGHKRSCGCLRNSGHSRHFTDVDMRRAVLRAERGMRRFREDNIRLRHKVKVLTSEVSRLHSVLGIDVQ